VGRFGPPLAVMGAIFFLSAQPDLDSGLGIVDLLGRKLIHAAEFGLLFFLWLRAMRFRHAGIAVLIAVAYAATDEFHQTFVEGRHGTPVDWAIDSFGVAVAFLLTGGVRHATGRPGGRRRGRGGSDPAALGGDEDGLGAVDGAELPVDVVQVRADGARRE